MECYIELIEVGNDEETLVILRAPLQAVLQVDGRDHRSSRHEYSLYAGVGIRHGSDRLIRDDLTYLCHVDAVAVVIQHELEDLKLLSTIFKKYIGVHGYLPSKK